jgi:hypothetical protein
MGRYLPTRVTALPGKYRREKEKGTRRGDKAKTEGS